MKNVKAKKVDTRKAYHHIRFRRPNEFIRDSFRNPVWAQHAASFWAKGAMVTTGQRPTGSYAIQKILIPKDRIPSKTEARAIADKIQDRLEREGRFTPKRKRRSSSKRSSARRSSKRR